MNEFEENKEIGHEAGYNVLFRMQVALDKRKAGLDKAALRISQALDAKETRQFCFQGDIVQAPELIDHKTRLSAAKMVVDIFGATAATKHEITGRGGGPLEVDITVRFIEAGNQE